MFAISITTQIGNGENTLFWTDRWIHGQSLLDLAPVLVVAVPKRILNRRTVAQALLNRTWIRDIQGALSVQVIMDYLHLWDILEEMVLIPDRDDIHYWKHTSSGHFSSKSAYRAFFTGAIAFEPWKRLWRSWAPLRCKLFLWLAIRNRCWTSDRLARRGLPHLVRCSFCDQDDETA